MIKHSDHINHHTTQPQLKHNLSKSTHQNSIDGIKQTKHSKHNEANNTHHMQANTQRQHTTQTHDLNTQIKTHTIEQQSPNQSKHIQTQSTRKYTNSAQPATQTNAQPKHHKINSTNQPNNNSTPQAITCFVLVRLFCCMY